MLDRPNPIGGEQCRVQSRTPDSSYIDYMPLPVRHGITLGELAQYINGSSPSPRPLNHPH